MGVFLAYAPAAYVYRIVIMVGIGLLIASKFFIFGIVFAIWSFFNTAIKPILKAFWHVFTNPRLRRRRTRAVSFATGGAVAVAVLLFLLPLPFTTISEGVVWLPERAHIRAGAPGFVERVEVAPRSRVAVDTRLLQLIDPTMDARIASLRARVRELDIQLAADRVKDIAKAEITRIEREEEAGRLAEEERKHLNMSVVAAIDGVFVPVIPAEDLPGRFVKEGELVGYVVPDEATTVRVAVTQADIDLVRARLNSVRLLPVGSRAAELSTRLIREVPAGQYALPTKALGHAGGGDVAIDPRDPEGMKALRRVFQFDLDLPDSTGASKFGSRLYVKFDHGWEPAGWQAYRRIRQLFLEWFDV
jgi:putative peptide zinc metalloprotease protein